MKKYIIPFILLSYISAQALPTISTSTKDSTSFELSNSETSSESESSTDTYSTSKTMTESDSYSDSDTETWSRAVTESNGVTTTAGGLLSMNVNLIPFLVEEIVNAYPNSERVKYAENVFPADLGFEKLAAEDQIVDMLAIDYYQNLDIGGSSSDSWDSDVDNKIKHVMKELFMLADEIVYMANILQADKDVNTNNLQVKMKKLLPEARRYALRMNPKIKGKCYFSDKKAYTCGRKYALSMNQVGRPTLHSTSKVIYGDNEIHGRSFSFNMTLGTSISEGLQIAETDSEARNQVWSLSTAIAKAESEGYNEANTLAVNKALALLGKESTDDSTSTEKNTNPIK